MRFKVSATEALQPNADHGRNIPAAVSQADQPITTVKRSVTLATDERTPCRANGSRKKKAHEEAAEAKRKEAEWEAKKKARDEAEQIAWERRFRWTTTPCLRPL